MTTTDMLTNEQREALKEYRDRHGRTWKNDLRLDWIRGRDVNALYSGQGHCLRQIRNRYGPSKLDKLAKELD